MSAPFSFQAKRAQQPRTAPLAGSGAARLLLLALDEVRPDPRAPRRVFDEDALDQLAESITCWGQLQPVVVRRVGDAYQLICGERRWRAHQRCGLSSIWAIERDATDQGALALALVENLHRVDLSHAEKVAGLDQLAELAHAQGLRKTAQQLRMDPSWLSRQLSVHRDPVIFAALEAGQVGFGQAAELCRAPQPYRQALIERIHAEDGSVSIATLRRWVEQVRDSSHAVRQTRRARVPESDSRTYRDILERLESLGAPQTADARETLQRVLVRVQELLLESSCAPSADKQTITELACLLCGERAGRVVDRQVQPARQGSVLLRGTTLLCGRCGGILAADARLEQYVYGAARAHRAVRTAAAS